MADGNREIERLPHTLERGAGFLAPGVQHALQAEEKGIVGV